MATPSVKYQLVSKSRYSTPLPIISTSSGPAQPRSQPQSRPQAPQNQPRSQPQHHPQSPAQSPSKPKPQPTQLRNLKPALVRDLSPISERSSIVDPADIGPPLGAAHNPPNFSRPWDTQSSSQDSASEPSRNSTDTSSDLRTESHDSSSASQPFSLDKDLDDFSPLSSLSSTSYRNEGPPKPAKQVTFSPATPNAPEDPPLPISPRSPPTGATVLSHIHHQKRRNLIDRQYPEVPALHAQYLPPAARNARRGAQLVPRDGTTVAMKPDPTEPDIMMEHVDGTNVTTSTDEHPDAPYARPEPIPEIEARDIRRIPPAEREGLDDVADGEWEGHPQFMDDGRLKGRHQARSPPPVGYGFSEGHARGRAGLDSDGAGAMGQVRAISPRPVVPPEDVTLEDGYSRLPPRLPRRKEGHDVPSTYAVNAQGSVVPQLQSRQSANAPAPAPVA